MAQSNNRAQQAFENMRLAAKYGIQRPSSTMLQGGVNYDAQPSTSGNAQSNQAFNIYQQLMQGGGRPTAPMVQPQQQDGVDLQSLIRSIQGSIPNPTPAYGSLHIPTFIAILQHFGIDPNQLTTGKNMGSMGL